jgi:hypothetical protein
MSLLDRIKSLFGGGSPDGADAHADHEPVAPPAPPADPTGLPTSEPASSEEDENQLP